MFPPPSTKKVLRLASEKTCRVRLRGVQTPFLSTSAMYIHCASDQQTFVIVAQIGLSIVIKGPCSFLKANFKLMQFSVTCYILC